MQTSKSPKIAPYGSWKSPITANLIASGSIKFKDLQINDGNIYWLESRPGEKGRNAIMRRVGDNQPEQILPAPFNARSKVHEYGGGAFLAHQGSIYFTNYSDQRVYCLQASSDPVPLTEPADFRYADMEMDQRRQRLIAVEEDHSNPANEPLNMLVAIDLSKEGKTAKLVSGNDFYAFPRLSPDSSQLCWLTWNHPRMPWEGTELWVSNINRDGSLSEQKLLAGGPNESIFQPQWSPDGTLYFVSDRNNWWNIYRYQDDKIEPVIEMEAEFGLPQWVFNMSTYAFASAHQIICAYTKHGNWHLAEIDLTRKSLQTIETAYTTLDQIRAKNGKAVFCGASPTHPTSLVELDVSTKSTRVIRTTFELSFDRAYLSLPQTISFPTTNNQHAYGFLYSPRNPDYKTNENENPPLIVFIHGGPTGSTDTGLNLKIQYWTSRGFAVLDVNYRGSTGYGRAFRELLKGQSGIVDVSDCVHGARYLCNQHQVDAERLIIRGSSAGGYIALAALTFYDDFKAGASYYGISDVEILAKDTHKFESKYIQWLNGPYPEQKVIYYQRSPIHFTDQLSSPIIFFQGLEDKVVPPDQAESMVNALREKGLPVTYVTFENEGHGFRDATNIQQSLENELYFYSRIFGFERAEVVQSVRIENLNG